jgi:drug/metabolite transporter (DMT)-like permease
MSETAKAPESGARAGDNVGRGIAISIAVVLVFGIQDAISKTLVQTYSPFEVVMIRYWAFVAVSLFLAGRKAPLRQAFKSSSPWLQTLRGILLMLDVWLFSLGNRTVPLAQLQAISLLYPLVVTIVAIPLLGERVGVFRASAVAVGFIGALIIVRPGGGLPLTLDALAAIGSSVAYAFYIVLTRRVSARDSTATSMVYVGVVGLVMSSAVGPFFWKSMDLHASLLMATLMVTMCLSHGLMMKALSMAPATILQPFSYLALPWGITLGFLVFGYLIDPISLVGAAIIAGAGLVVLARERRKAKTPAVTAEALGPRD